MELLKSLIVIAIHFNVLLACVSLRAIEENAIKSLYAGYKDICFRKGRRKGH